MIVPHKSPARLDFTQGWCGWPRGATTLYKKLHTGYCQGTNPNDQPFRLLSWPHLHIISHIIRHSFDTPFNLPGPAWLGLVLCGDISICIMMLP